MKKIIFGLLFMVAGGLCFTACSDDDNNGNQIHATTPEKVAVGTYSGTYTVSWTDKTGSYTETKDGTVTLNAADAAYTVNVSVDAPKGEKTPALSKESVANITYVNEGFAFSNMLVTNGLGTTFAGTISEGDALAMNFTISVKNGRQVVTYKYAFVGQKQN